MCIHKIDQITEFVFRRQDSWKGVKEGMKALILIATNIIDVERCTTYIRIVQTYNATSAGKVHDNEVIRSVENE